MYDSNDGQHCQELFILRCDTIDQEATHFQVDQTNAPSLGSPTEIVFYTGWVVTNLPFDE